MASVNRVMILGNLGQDPELKYTASQTPVVTLSVATTDYRTVDGQRQDQTEWHRIVVWGKQAENCSKYLAKGRSVFVEGRLQTRSWEDKNGQKRYTTEIVAQNVKFIGGGRSEGASNSYGQQNDQQGGGGGYSNDNYGGGGGGGQSEQSFGGPETPSLDEIPF